MIHNPNFKVVEFDHFRMQAGLPSFVMSVSYSIFGCSKEEVQKLYIQSVIESMASGKTVEVSRWVTSGDWNNDDEEMTITIP